MSLANSEVRYSLPDVMRNALRQAPEDNQYWMSQLIAAIERLGPEGQANSNKVAIKLEKTREGLVARSSGSRVRIDEATNVLKRVAAGWHQNRVIPPGGLGIVDSKPSSESPRAQNCQRRVRYSGPPQRLASRG